MDIKNQQRLVPRDGAGESESEIGLSGLGGLQEGSIAPAGTFLTDERLWRSGLLRGGLESPAGLVACRVLEPFHDGHHGGVTIAGTARGRGGSWTHSAPRDLSLAARVGLGSWAVVPSPPAGSRYSASSRVSWARRDGEEDNPPLWC